MGCTAITDYVVRESGRYLADQIRSRNFAVSPWMTLINRGEFPKGLGETISTLTYERTAPTDAEPAWTTVATVDGAEGGACLPPATKIGVGSTTRTFTLYRRVLEGPDFCAEDLRSVFELTQQLNAISQVLAEYVRIEWDIHDRHEYFRMVKRKAVANGVGGCGGSNTFTQAATYPIHAATSPLTQGMLDFYKARLMRDGAGQSAMGRVDGAPVLTLITSWETSQNIITQNDALRQDLRWGKPSELLAALGVERSYKGFFHVTDAYPRRFTFGGGGYVEVPAFSTEAATKGQKAEVNASWESAPYEESFIFDPSVFLQLIPRPITSPAAKFDFSPVNYTGVWVTKNIPDRVCNPDENILYHRGILAAGSLPMYPERGVAIIHLRCDTPCALTAGCVS